MTSYRKWSHKVMAAKGAYFLNNMVWYFILSFKDEPIDRLLFFSFLFVIGDCNRYLPARNYCSSLWSHWVYICWRQPRRTLFNTCIFMSWYISLHLKKKKKQVSHWLFVVLQKNIVESAKNEKISENCNRCYSEVWHYFANFKSLSLLCPDTVNVASFPHVCMLKEPDWLADSSHTLM